MIVFFRRIPFAKYAPVITERDPGGLFGDIEKGVRLGQGRHAGDRDGPDRHRFGVSQIYILEGGFQNQAFAAFKRSFRCRVDAAEQREQKACPEHAQHPVSHRPSCNRGRAGGTIRSVGECVYRIGSHLLRILAGWRTRGTGLPPKLPLSIENAN